MFVYLGLQIFNILYYVREFFWHFKTGAVQPVVLDMKRNCFHPSIVLVKR